MDEVSSTNDYLSSLATEGTATHGAVVSAIRQTRGRGQAGSQWESQPGKNIQMSVFIVPPSIMADEQVYLNLFASLAVFDMVSHYLPGSTAIKWPNDIFSGDRKIAGILIENNLHGTSINSSIIGIGVNINQQNFVAPGAVSLATLTGNELDVSACLQRLIDCLNKRYAELSLHLKYKLRQDYLRVMYKREQKAWFRAHNEMIEGEIEGIDDMGRLKLRSNEGIVKDTKTLNGYCLIISMWWFTFSGKINGNFMPWKSYGAMRKKFLSRPVKYLRLHGCNQQ